MTEEEGRREKCGMAYNLNAELNSHRGIVSNHSNKHADTQRHRHTICFIRFQQIAKQNLCRQNVFYILEIFSRRIFAWAEKKATTKIPHPYAANMMLPDEMKCRFFLPFFLILTSFSFSVFFAHIACIDLLIYIGVCYMCICRGLSVGIFS